MCRDPVSPAEVSPGGRRHAIVTGPSNLAENFCCRGAKIIKPRPALFIWQKFPLSVGASKNVSTNGRAGARGPGLSAGRRLRGRRGESGGGRDVATGLLKLVPFFLRTWTLLRLSRGKSDSLSAYLRPPQPPALSRPCQVWNHLRTPTWALYRSLGSKAGVEGPEERRWKSRSCPVLPHFVPCGRRQAGGGWGMRD